MRGRKRAATLLPLDCPDGHLGAGAATRSASANQRNTAQDVIRHSTAGRTAWHTHTATAAQHSTLTAQPHSALLHKQPTRNASVSLPPSSDDEQQLTKSMKLKEGAAKRDGGQTRGEERRV